MVFVSGLCVLASLAWLVLRPPELGRQAGAALAVSVVAFVGGAVLWAKPDVMSARRLNMVAAIATLGLGVVAYAVGAEMFPYVIIFYVWVGCSVPFWTRLRGLGHLALAFGVCAFVISIQPGHVAAVAGWVVFVGAVGIAAGVVEWAVQRITAVAMDQRRARHELEEASARLEVVNQQKRDFLAATSHELRTPLNAIIGFSDVLSEQVVGPLNQRQAEYVDDIRTSGQHLLGLISDVLDMAKVESGRLELEEAEVDMAELLARTTGLFREQASRNGVELVLDAEVGSVRGDERKIRQVVVNLLANAVALTPSGGKVVVRARDVTEGVEITVADTGPGIAPEDQERIFEAFQQGGRGERAGTGLGLPLARRFVEAHGGVLHVRSRLGVGSTFTFTLASRPPPSRAAGTDSGIAAGGPTPTDELMRQTTRVASFFALWGSALAAFAAALLALRGGKIPGFRPGVVIVMSVLALLIGLGLRRYERSFTSRDYVVLCCVFTAMLTIGGYFAGPVVTSYGAVGYTWAALASFMLLNRRQGLQMLVVIGAGHAWLVIAQTGNSLPVVRWLLLAVACWGCAALMAWLMGKLRTLLGAEHEARLDVERSWVELEQVSRHKSEFLANMSHELRTPLNAVIGFADVLHEELFGPLNPKQSEYVADIMESGRQLLALINDILDLAKAEAGHVELTVGDVALAELVQRAVEGHAVELGERHLRVAVTVDAAADVVQADPLRLGRALANLLSNAVKFSPDGGEIDVRATRDNGEVVLAVRDHGPGIAPSDQDRIFDEFQQGVPAGLASPGAGLGLAIARTFAELHQGRVEVDSEPGHGSTFRLRIPQPS